MAEQNSNGGKKSKSQPVWNLLKFNQLKGFFSDWRRLSGLYAILFLVISILLFPPTKKLREIQYSEGNIADSDVIAPFEFTVPYSEREIQTNRAQAVVDSPPVYRKRVDAGERLIGDLREFFSGVESITGNDSLSQGERLNRIRSFIPEIETDLLAGLLNDNNRKKLRRESIALLERMLDQGIINDASPLRRRNYLHVSVISGDQEHLARASSLISQDQLEGLILDRAQEVFGKNKEDLIALFYNISRSFLEPNLIFDRDETRNRRDLKLKNVPKFFQISRNQRIIAKHDKITEKQINILRAMEEERARREMRTSFLSTLKLFLGKGLSILILLFIFGISVYRFVPELLRDPSRLTISFIIILFYLFSLMLVNRVEPLNYFSIPVAFVPLLASALFGSLPALLFVVFVSLMLITHIDLSGWPVFIFIFTGAVAIMSMTHLRERKNFYKIFIYLALAYVVSTISLSLLGGGTSGEQLFQMFQGITSSLVSTFLVMFLMPVFETLFDITTDFTLMELSDLNRPLLKRLSIEAPGSYHHSIMIGNMVESVADAIGANGLLARVSAYYHDIGKLAKPEYFYENKGETISKHEKLTPSMSSLVLASHVKEGVELAEQEKLPRVIIDSIKQHHGTCVMSYFYKKALEYDSADGVNKDDFRYQGPRPQTRENALIMLADAAEAAVRSLEDPSAGRIRSVVESIFDERMNEGELDESGLTLKDISIVREGFIKILTGIFHRRVAYPGQEKIEGEKSDSNESTDSQ